MLMPKSKAAAMEPPSRPAEPLVPSPRSAQPPTDPNPPAPRPGWLLTGGKNRKPGHNRKPEDGCLNRLAACWCAPNPNRSARKQCPETTIWPLRRWKDRRWYGRPSKTAKPEAIRPSPCPDTRKVPSG